MLNNHRLSIGLEPLGFVNPWLYGDGLMGFNDITVGSNPGDAGGTDGFSAGKGWDPVRPPRAFVFFRFDLR